MFAGSNQVCPHPTIKQTPQPAAYERPASVAFRYVLGPTRETP